MSSLSYLIVPSRRQRKRMFRNQVIEKQRLIDESIESNLLKNCPCDHCLAFDLICRKMPSSKRSFKCPECYKAGVSCFRTSWASLDRRRNDLKQDIKNDQKLRDQLLIQFRKI